MSENVGQYGALGEMIKEKGPIRLVAEQNFRAVISKAFEAAGFNHASLRQLDELINRLAQEAGVPTKDLKLGIEVDARSRLQHNNDVTVNAVVVVRTTGGEDVPVNVHFDGIEAPPAPVDPNAAYNYWKTRWEDDPVVNPPDEDVPGKLREHMPPKDDVPTEAAP